VATIRKRILWPNRHPFRRHNFTSPLNAGPVFDLSICRCSLNQPMSRIPTSAVKTTRIMTVVRISTTLLPHLGMSCQKLRLPPLGRKNSPSHCYSPSPHICICSRAPSPPPTSALVGFDAWMGSPCTSNSHLILASIGGPRNGYWIVPGIMCN
jgi:hypothetical protein